MSASPGEVVRVRLGAGTNSDTNYSISTDAAEGDRIVGTYEGPVVKMPSLNYVEEIVEGTVPPSSVGSLVWSTTVNPHPIAAEFRQFVKDSEDGRDMVCFTEWAMKNCDGVMLRQIRDVYRTKYGKNVMFDGDSMFYLIDRCKTLEERLERIERNQSTHKRTARR